MLVIAGIAGLEMQVTGGGTDISRAVSTIPHGASHWMATMVFARRLDAKDKNSNCSSRNKQWLYWNRKLVRSVQYGATGGHEDHQMQGLKVAPGGRTVIGHGGL